MDLIAARIHDKCATATKSTTQMDHSSNYQNICGVNFIAAFITSTRLVEIETQGLWRAYPALVRVCSTLVQVYPTLVRRCPARFRCRPIMAYKRQSRPGSGLSFRAKVLETFRSVPSSLGSGLGKPCTNYGCRWHQLDYQSLDHQFDHETRKKKGS